jgi:hypothetical protein
VRWPTGWGVVVVMTAALVSMPVAEVGIMAVSVTTAVAPGASEPIVQVRVGPDCAAHDPTEVVAVAPEMTAGSVSTTLTVAAVDGPLFVASISQPMGWPATTAAVRTRFVMVTSADGATGVVRLVELFVVTGSNVEDETDALLTSEVLTRGSTVPTMLTVVLAPAAKDAIAQDTDDRVHGPAGEVIDVAVKPDGKSSATTSERASEGPAFSIVKRYVPDCPGTSVDGVDDFVIETFARGVSEVVAVGELFDGSGSGVADPVVAMFGTDAVELDAIPAAMVNVAEAPTASEASEQFTVVPSVHDPDGTDADVAVSPAGMRSATVTAVAIDGPSFVTTMAYEIG